MPQDKHIARKLIRSTQVTPRPGDHRLAHTQLGHPPGLPLRAESAQDRLLGPSWALRTELSLMC